MNKNRSFWPVAMYVDHSKNTIRHISTTNACSTFEDAWNQIIDYWKNGYEFDIIYAHIDIYENGEQISQAIIINKDDMKK